MNLFFFSTLAPTTTATAKQAGNKRFCLGHRRRLPIVVNVVIVSPKNNTSMQIQNQTHTYIKSLPIRDALQHGTCYSETKTNSKSDIKPNA